MTGFGNSLNRTTPDYQDTNKIAHRFDFWPPSGAMMSLLVTAAIATFKLACQTQPMMWKPFDKACRNSISTLLESILPPLMDSVRLLELTLLVKRLPGVSFRLGNMRKLRIKGGLRIIMSYEFCRQGFEPSSDVLSARTSSLFAIAVLSHTRSQAPPSAASLRDKVSSLVSDRTILV